MLALPWVARWQDESFLAWAWSSPYGYGRDILSAKQKDGRCWVVGFYSYARDAADTPITETGETPK